jgi:hypothetical protein
VHKSTRRSTQQEHGQDTTKKYTTCCRLSKRPGCRLAKGWRWRCSTEATRRAEAACCGLRGAKRGCSRAEGGGWVRLAEAAARVGGGRAETEPAGLRGLPEAAPAERSE